MSDPIASALSRPRNVPAAGSLTNRVQLLLPLVEAVTEALADPDGQFSVRIQEASPEERADLARLVYVLDALIGPLELRRKALDNAVRLAHVRSGADKFPIEGGGAIGLEKPDVSYQIDVEGLRKALIDLIPEGIVTKQEIDAAFTQIISWKVDNRKLNYLRDHAGEKVAQAIAQHRRKPEVDPSRMRVKWPKP